MKHKTIIVLLLLIILLLLINNRSTKKMQKIKHVKIPIKQYVPVNIPTRGIEDFRQIGILSGNNGKVLPLYGRRTYNGSNRWNYFTKANDHLSLKIPLEKNGKDCDEQNGCDELYDDDLLHVPEYNTDFKIKLYDTTPRYIPHILT